MIDIHSHILNNVDDGSMSLDESIKLLQRLESDGVTDIILTPHYIENSIYDINNVEKVKKFNLLKNELKKNNLKINIYLGNEVFISDNILESFKYNTMTLNHSRYLLIEESLEIEYQDIDIILKELINNNIIPIIAHPERYSFFKEDYKKINEYMELGVLFQGNYESLFDKYGKESRKLLIKMLKNKVISFLASDIHHISSELHLKELKEKLKRIIGDNKYIDDLLYNNAKKVLENKLL